jgi:hypothetical protein
MRLKRTVPLFLALSMIPGLCGTAFAGVEPSPFHTVISNRTDRLGSASTFYNQNMYGMELIVRVSVVNDAGTAGGTAEIVIPVLSDAGGDLTLAPGQTLAYAVDPAQFTSLRLSGQVLSWSLYAKMGIEPSPWQPAFAFETKLAAPPDPYQPPSLAPSYLTGEMPILAFASPGVLVGTVALVNDELFYSSCPSVPPAGSAWKSHGQYVRCVAWQAEDLAFMGRISSEEADAIVSDAAQSETGK